MRLALRVVLRSLGIALAVTGVVMFVLILTTEAATNAVTAEYQAEARERIISSAPPSTPPTTDVTISSHPADMPGWNESITPPERPEARTKYEPGEAMGTLTLLDEEWVVVYGVGVEDLKLGPGSAPWTPYPGEEGNATLSGHRTTYGAPFHDIDLLAPGDELVWTDLEGEVTVYVVTETLIVTPEDVWVTLDRGEGKMLTLTACHPKGSARERIVVWAEEA